MTFAGHRKRQILLATAAALLIADGAWFVAVWPQLVGEQVLVRVENLEHTNHAGLQKTLPTAYFQMNPARLAEDDSAWMVGSERVTNLLRYLQSKQGHAPFDRGYLENTRVSLGNTPTFGRAMTALQRLAAEGACKSGIEIDDYSGASDNAIQMFNILTYRDEAGRERRCINQHI